MNLQEKPRSLTEEFKTVQTPLLLLLYKSFTNDKCYWFFCFENATSIYLKHPLGDCASVPREQRLVD